MGGRHCCVVNCRRRSHDHRGRKIPNGLTFHCFPTWRRHEGEQVSRLTKSRRAAWVAAVDRPDITFNHVPASTRVCSRHFQSGKPAYEMLESHPDWVPSLHLSPSEGNTRRTVRLLQSVQKGRDQNQRCSTETRPPHETEPEITAGPVRLAVRPWREVKSLLHAVLQRKTNFSKQPVRKMDLHFRDFFRDALEASLEASSRSRALSGRLSSTSGEHTVEPNHTSSSSSSSSCVNCVRLQRRNKQLEEELSHLTGGQTDMEASPGFNKAPLQPDEDLQSPETAHVQEQWTEPVSPLQPLLHEADQDVNPANDCKDQASKRKPRRPPRFQKTWLKQFWFLRYSPTLDQMWCHVCRLRSDKSHQNSGLIKGSRLFRFQNIKQHSVSNYHKDCVSRHMLDMCSLQL